LKKKIEEEENEKIWKHTRTEISSSPTLIRPARLALLPRNIRLTCFCRIFFMFQIDACVRASI
jgi:hypothetical protein